MGAALFRGIIDAPEKLQSLDQVGNVFRLEQAMSHVCRQKAERQQYCAFFCTGTQYSYSINGGIILLPLRLDKTLHSTPRACP